MKVLNDSQKAKEIVRIIRVEVERSNLHYISTFGDLKKEEAEFGMWESQQKENGYVDRSLYSKEVEHKRKIFESANEQKKYREEILNYAVDVFLDKI
jgi:hypothetical protein